MEEFNLGKTHFVKSWPETFEPSIQGIKKFDYRNNDRNYQIGDQIVKREYIPKRLQSSTSSCLTTLGYTGRAAQFQILRVWTNIPEMPKEYCILEIGEPKSVYYLDPAWESPELL